MKHVPLRRCVVCRSSRPQAELLRLRRDETGAWQLDLAGRGGGRGAWLCRDAEACQHLKNLRRFFRHDAVAVAQQLQALRLAPGG